MVMQRSVTREADQFHQAAWSVLSGTGFDLINDPTKVISPYQKSHALYRSQRGLYLLAGFEPADGNTAGMACGRLWSEQKGLGWFALSGEYYQLAKRLGFDVPKHYDLGYGDNISKALESMVDDLKLTLPTVVSRVTLADLVSIERGEFGAQRIAQALFGTNYLRHVSIGDFPSSAS